MLGFSNKIISLQLRYPLLWLLAFCLPLAFLWAQASRVIQASDIDYFEVPNEDKEFFERFKQVFRNDEFFVVAVEAGNLFSPEVIQVIKSLTEEIRQLPHVRKVNSLARVDYIEGDETSFQVREFLDPLPTTKEGFARLKERALAEPLYRGSITSEDGRTAGIMVFVDGASNGQEFRVQLLADVRRIISEVNRDGLNISVAGWTVTNVQLADTLQRDLGVLMPLCILVIAIVVSIIFRDLKITAIVMITILASLAGVLGVFGWSGITLNNITVIVLPLAMILSLADTMHVTSHVKSLALPDGRERTGPLANELSRIVAPCLFTSLTTAIGFISLKTSAMPAMGDFGLIASSAMMLEFLLAFGLVPALLILFKVDIGTKLGATVKQDWLDSMLHQTIDYVNRSKKLVASALLLIMSLGIASIAWLKVESNAIEYFSKESEFRQSIDFIESHLGGVGSFDISLTAEEQDYFMRHEALEYLDQFAEHLRTHPQIDYVTSFADFIKDMNRAFHGNDANYRRIPDTDDAIAQYMLIYDGKDYADYLNRKNNHARIAVRMGVNNSREQEILLKWVRDYAATHSPPPGLDVRVTGQIISHLNIAHEMVNGQLSSFGTAVVSIGVLMIIILRSFKLGLLSLLPNVFPIALLFGFMAALGIPLETGTVMIASVALGIACDDTVHFMHRFRNSLLRGMAVDEAVQHVVLTKGRAMLISVLILTLGFGVILFAEFLPAKRFGILTTVTLAVSVIGDLFLLPAVILLLPKRFFTLKPDREVPLTFPGTIETTTELPHSS